MWHQYGGMLIQAYGRFWDRDLVAWHAHGWRLLGRQGLLKGTIQVADFRHARGVYVLYNEVGPYYVGLSKTQSKGIGGRLRDHLNDKHGSLWTRFSWFSFDAPSVKNADRVLSPAAAPKVQGQSGFAIDDMEALLQRAIAPFANIQEAQFKAGKVEWVQVATRTPEIRTFDSIRNAL